MPKYRYLSDEELSHLEDELKQFLIVNHVYGEEWTKINEENPEKAMQLIGLFSDQILHRAYEKITYIEKRTKEACFVFKFEADQMYMIIIQLKNESVKLDLSSPESIHKALVNHMSELEFFKSSKAVKPTKEQEIHQLLEQGAVLSSLEFWQELENMLK